MLQLILVDALVDDCSKVQICTVIYRNKMLILTFVSLFVFIESLHEMESRIQKNSGKYGKDGVHENNTECVEPVLVNDIHVEEDKYVAVDEKLCTFKGTFSDSEDELDTEFVYFILFCILYVVCN